MDQMHGGLWEYQRGLPSRGGERPAGRRFQYGGSYGGASIVRGLWVHTQMPQAQCGRLGEPLEKVTSQVRQRRGEG